MLQTARWGLCSSLLSTVDFVLSLGNREETALCGKHTICWQVDSGYCRSEWCGAGAIFLEFNSLQDVLEGWSEAILWKWGGLKRGCFVLVLFGCFGVLGIFYFVLGCLFVCCFFFFSSFFWCRQILGRSARCCVFPTCALLAGDSLYKAEPYSSGNLKGYTWGGKKRERRRY